MLSNEMKLLRELLSNKFSDPHKYAYESVDDIVDTGPDYVPMKKKKAKNRRFPTTDKAENALINNIWFYNNSDAS